MNLPHEVIVKILNYLDLESLKQCILVSHNFREIILTSPKIMRRFEIYFNKINDIDDAVPFFAKFGRNIRHLALNCLELYTDEQVENILKLVPNLETIFCFEDTIKNKSSPASGPNVKLEKLKQAEIFISNRSVKFIDKFLENSSKLEYFKVERIDMDEVGDEFFVNLMNKGELKKLVLDNVIFTGNGFESKIPKPYKLKLNKLVMRNDMYLKPNANFTEFLKSQANSVTKLRSNFDEDLRSLEIIVKEFKFVESAKFRVDSKEAKKVATDLQNCQMASVKKLKIRGEIFMNEFQLFLSLFPNIEKLNLLELEYSRDYKFNEIFLLFPKLSNIVFGEINVKCIANLQMPNLKVLKISSSYFLYFLKKYDGFWHKLFMNCPNIEYLTVALPIGNHFDINFMKIVRELMRCMEDLRNLKLFKFENIKKKFDIDVDVVANTKIVKCYKESEGFEFGSDYADFEIAKVDKYHPWYKYD